MSCLGMFCRRDHKEIEAEVEITKVFPNEEHTLNLEVVKYFTDIGIVREICFAVAKPRSVIEKLKAIHVLRFMCWYLPAAKILHEMNTLPQIFLSFKNARNEVLDLYDQQFTKYQLYIACFGTNGTKFDNAVALDEITQEEARDRTLERVYGLQENAGALIALHCRFPGGIQSCWKEGVIDQHLELLKRNCSKEGEDDYMTCVWMTFKFLCSKQNQCEILISKNIVNLLKKWIFHPTHTLFLHTMKCLRQLIKKSSVRKEIVKETHIINFIVDNIHNCVGSAQMEILKFLSELSTEKSVMKILSNEPKECFFEVCLAYSKNHAEIGAKIIQSIDQYFPNYISPKQLMNMPDYMRNGDRDAERILHFKNKGNEFFKNKEFVKAILEYDKGINLCNFWGNDLLTTLHSNRAECNIQLKNFDDAMRDCAKAMAGDILHIKSMIRFGKCLQEKEMYFEALNYFQIAYIRSKNQDILKSIVVRIRILF
jgi:tetratricopeptide (TPR) repeat protein